MKQVLFTGGSGLVGIRLSEMLHQRGYSVGWLLRGSSREKHIPAYVKGYRWNIKTNELDPAALSESHYLVHLAGAGIADERWTPARKAEIVSSRTETISFLLNKMAEIPHRFEAVVSASGTGYYGGDTGAEWLSEQFTPGDDFLADVCVAWEAAADHATKLGIRTVKLRTGIVLSLLGGALPKITNPIRWGVGAALGNGQQLQSWIHLDDLCELYIHSLENTSMSGSYNAVSPQPITNQELTKAIAKQLGRPLWLPNIPAWVMRTALGELAILVLGGHYILNQRIQLETDFQYKFPDLEAALENIFAKR